jgi:hypothetical protein
MASDWAESGVGIMVATPAAAAAASTSRRVRADWASGMTFSSAAIGALAEQISSLTLADNSAVAIARWYRRYFGINWQSSIKKPLSHP